MSILNITYAQSPYNAGMSSIILADCTDGPITVNLPPAALAKGWTYTIKKIDSSPNAVTIDADTNETIDGDDTQTLKARHTVLTLISSGIKWYISA